MFTSLACKSILTGTQSQERKSARGEHLRTFRAVMKMPRWSLATSSRTISSARNWLGCERELAAACSVIGLYSFFAREGWHFTLWGYPCQQPYHLLSTRSSSLLLDSAKMSLARRVKSMNCPHTSCSTLHSQAHARRPGKYHPQSADWELILRGDHSLEMAKPGRAPGSIPGQQSWKHTVKFVLKSKMTSYRCPHLVILILQVKPD